MKKQMTRLGALVLCAVMLLGMLPLTANAAINHPEDSPWLYYFETFEDLKELASTYTEHDTAYFMFEGERLVISEDITLPENVHLSGINNGGAVEISAGATLTVGNLDADIITVDGILCASSVIANDSLAVTGAVYADYACSGSLPVGAENIRPADAAVEINATVVTMEDLLDALAQVEQLDASEVLYTIDVDRYDVDGDWALTLTESIVLPANCRLVSGYELVIPAGVSITGEGSILMGSGLYVSGTLDIPLLEITDFVGGYLVVEDGGSVDCDQIVIDSIWGEPTMDWLADILSGLDLSGYTVDDSSSDTWILTKGASCPDAGDVTWTLEDGTLTVSGTGAIADYGFNEAPWYAHADEITTLVIGEGITAIGANSFSNLMSLTDIYLPASLEAIAFSAFAYGMGDSIENVHLADLAAWCAVELEDYYWTSPVSFAENLYVGGEPVTDLVIPEGVTSISDHAFGRTCCLNSVELPASVTAIGASAFMSSSVKTVTVYGDLESVGEQAFFMSEVESVEFTGNAPADAGNLFDFYNMPVTVSYPADNDTWTEEFLSADYPASIVWVPVEAALPSGTCGENLTWTLEDGTLTISGTGAIDDYGPVLVAAPWVNGETLESIEEAVIMEGVTRIGDFTFYCHRGLKTVTIPASVTSIGDYIFDGTEKLEEVYFCGDAPAIDDVIFGATSPTAYYPAGNDTWTEEFRASCGDGVTWVPYEVQGEAVPGDVDGDGTVSDADVAQLLWHTLFPETYDVSGNADYNGDGIVDDQDVAYLLWHTLFPEQYPIN